MLTKRADREYLASTVEFLGNEAGEVRAVVVCETEYRDGGRFPKPGTEREIPADLVLLALGYRGAEHQTAGANQSHRRRSRKPRRDASYATRSLVCLLPGMQGVVRR